MIARDSTARGRPRRRVEERGATRKAPHEDRRAGRDRGSARLDVEIQAVEVVDGGAAHRRKRRHPTRAGFGCWPRCWRSRSFENAVTSNSATDVAIMWPEFLGSYVMRARARRFPPSRSQPARKREVRQPFPRSLCRPPTTESRACRASRLLDVLGLRSPATPLRRHPVAYQTPCRESRNRSPGFEKACCSACDHRVGH